MVKDQMHYIYEIGKNFNKQTIDGNRSQFKSPKSCANFKGQLCAFTQLFLSEFFDECVLISYQNVSS